MTAQTTAAPIDANLIEQLAQALAHHIRPTIPVSIDLWDTENVASYLKRSINRVRSDIVCLPSFPRPIRLPVQGRSQALYKAREVIAWAESHKAS